MLNNKVLLVVNSVYQLFTAVHMKRSILAKKEADLLVTDITAVLHTYIPRLKETGLFAQVIFGKTKEWNQKYAAAKGDTLDEGFQNASHTLRWMLNEELADYSEVYFPTSIHLSATVERCVTAPPVNSSGMRMAFQPM